MNVALLGTRCIIRPKQMGPESQVLPFSSSSKAVIAADCTDADRNDRDFDRDSDSGGTHNAEHYQKHQRSDEVRKVQGLKQ